MKTKITISIDTELEKEIRKIVDTEIQKKVNGKSVSSRKINKIMREINFSSVTEKLIKKGLYAKKIGL